jgi:polar amino acid transport system ATP-binding protein
LLRVTKRAAIGKHHARGSIETILSQKFPESGIDRRAIMRAFLRPMPDPLLAVKNLHKSFNETPILKGVSLDVEEGDLVSIIGPSGCGKSTMLRCMNFLEIPDAGRISIAGVTIDCQGLEDAPPRDLQVRAHQLRQKVGMVFQQFNLFPHRTILENTMLAPMVASKVPREDAEKNGRRLLEKVGLGALADR